MEQIKKKMSALKQEKEAALEAAENAERELKEQKNKVDQV